MSVRAKIEPPVAGAEGRAGAFALSSSDLRQAPEIRILRTGFPLSLAWEILQSPFYADTYDAPISTIAYNRIHCSVGDVLILFSAFWIVAAVWGRRWMSMARLKPILLFLAVGLAYTAFSEYLNVQINGSWSYSAWMPVLYGMGLVPLLQWILVPTLVLLIVRISDPSEEIK